MPAHPTSIITAKPSGRRHFVAHFLFGNIGKVRLKLVQVFGKLVRIKIRQRLHIGEQTVQRGLRRLVIFQHRQRGNEAVERSARRSARRAQTGCGIPLAKSAEAFASADKVVCDDFAVHEMLAAAIARSSPHF